MDNIFIADYDPSWPHLFEIEAVRIHEVLGNLILAIEHFGSTAVPGLAAKPIIDILVGVRSLSESSPILLPSLEALGYRYWRENPRSNADVLCQRVAAQWSAHAPRSYC
jgi:GrpB-like predicted nucleotidyltransferase (UPF0157 family)